jgi:quinoprotein glucose dehydrogenase
MKGRLAFIVALTFGCSSGSEVDYSGPVAGWPEYGAAKGGGRYSPLTQITRQNVDELEIAWTYHTGDYADGSASLAPSSFQNTPILVEDTLYICTPFNRVIALDAETGAERWSYDPEVDTTELYVTACRGVTFWDDPQASTGASCARRIFMGTLDARLIALDAQSGRPCEDFGQGGEVDLRRNIGPIGPGEYGVTSPPVVARDLVVTGTLVLDNRRVDAPSGVVRAFDARSGELRWSWNPVPPGLNPVQDDPVRDVSIYRRGTPNVWSIMSVDEERGLIFAPTGNASPDYYAADRRGLDYYASSVVALHASSGQVVWHFKTVNRDVWDYDVSSQPTLFEFPGGRDPTPALVQATKMGHLFFLNRESGEPIFEVVERPVPQGGVPGEVLAPTQPFPTRPPPIHPGEPLTPDDAWGVTFWDRGKCRERIAAARSEGIFTPPSLEGSIHYPGMSGGVNWGSPAIDPKRGILVVNTTRVATHVKMVPRAEVTPEQMATKYGFEPALGSRYALERSVLFSPLGAPCNPPPWGTLVGIDIASGEILWDVPLGTTRDIAPFPYWRKLGVPNMGGPMITGSGLVFIGAASDDFLRAFDSETGEELWKGRLPAGGQATPMTYRTSADRKQFVVIAAGGHGLMRTSGGDAIVAFSLP